MKFLVWPLQGLRNYLAKHFTVKWWGGFLCDHCHIMDKTWHIARTNKRGIYRYHHIKCPEIKRKKIKKGKIIYGVQY